MPAKPHLEPVAVRPASPVGTPDGPPLVPERTGPADPTDRD